MSRPSAPPRTIAELANADGRLDDVRMDAAQPEPLDGLEVGPTLCGPAAINHVVDLGALGD